MNIIKKFIEKFSKKKRVEPTFEPAYQGVHSETTVDNAPYQQPEGQSLLRPTLPGVKTLKKKWILFVVILFGLIFAISFMFSSKKREIPTNQNLNKNVATSPYNENNKDLSYSDLMKKQQGMNQGNPNNMRVNANGQAINGQGQQGNAYDQYGHGQQENVSINRIPYNNSNGGRLQLPSSNGSSFNPGYTPYLAGGYQQPYQVQQPYQNQQTMQAQSSITKIENYLRSAIGFNIGSDDSGVAQASATAVGYTGVSNVSQNVLQAGSLIPVTLLTGIDSDLPSQVVCQVRENVYDSVSGDVMLIPQGTKIIGDVNNGSVGVAQERIAVAWKRMILPNGYSVNLGGMPAVDTSGYPGLKDRVNQHEGKILGATLITGLLSAAAQIASGNSSTDDDQTYSQLAVSGAATNIMNAGAKILDRNINISPTIQISPGTPFNIFVNQDVTLQPYE